MWEDFDPEEIAGKGRLIDRLELVKDFLDMELEIPVISPEKLAFACSRV